MRFGPIPLDEAEGAVLAHSLGVGKTVLRKGRRLSIADLAALRAEGVTSVVAAASGPDELSEDAAAHRLALAVAGEAVSVAEPFTGRANLHAETKGVLVVDPERIDRFNTLDEAITLATLPAFAVVEPRQMVATIKIIPFAVPATLVDEALDLVAEAGPLVGVAPFRQLRYRLVQTVLPGTSAKMLDKTVRVTAERIQAAGGELLGESRCAHEVEALRSAIREADAAGFDLLLIAGASAITDRRDVLPAAIEAAGGRVEHFGMPVDPGNLLLLANLDDRLVLGLPGCCRSPKLNGFDWVLQRLAAGLAVTRRDIQRMGVGGLLMEIPSRPQPREGGEAGTRARPPKVAAIVLAAGQSRRMGERNKLVMTIEGKPMVRHVVEAALASKADPVWVVLGHEQHQVRQALRGLKVRFVTNPDYAEGLSTSFKAGIAALGEDVDGAVICLGDMPRITARHIDRLIQAFNPLEGRSIVVPTWHGKRGNPVLWGKSHFPEFREIAGDVGARHLIGRHEEELVQVEMEDGASLVDIDTPEAYAALTGASA